MNEGRRRALIQAHCALRKEAFAGVAPHVQAFFEEARNALSGAKHASESVHFHPALRAHLLEP